jgi:hypothetical protein
MKISTIKKIKEISDGWDWGNYKDDKTGNSWSVLQALYCKLSWVEEYLKDKDDEEYQDIVSDAMKIVEVLQKEIKI